MRWIVLILLFFAYFINYADKAIIGYAADPLIKEFSLSSTQWGLVGSSFFFLFAITGLIGGTLSDRFGTSRMIVIMLSAWTILQFGSYFIMSLPMLIVYRVLLGAFEGPFGPVALSHTSKWFPQELRGRAFSILIAGASIGGIISAPILVAFIERYGWRLTFLFMGILSLVWIFFWLLMERKNKRSQNKHYIINKNTVKKLKWRDVDVILRNPACFLTLALGFSSYWLVTWLIVWLPIYLTQVVKLEPMKMAYTIAGTGVTSTVLVLLISVLSDLIYKKTKSNQKARVRITGISTIIGGLCLAIVPLSDSFIWIFITLCIAKASTYVVATTGPQILIQLMPERSGFMASIFTFLTNIGSLIAPIITGIIVQYGGKNITLGFHYSIYFMVVMFCITSILFLTFVKLDKTPGLPSPNTHTM